MTDTGTDHGRGTLEVILPRPGTIRAVEAVGPDSVSYGIETTTGRSSVIFEGQAGVWAINVFEIGGPPRVSAAHVTAGARTTERVAPAGPRRRAPRDWGLVPLFGGDAAAIGGLLMSLTFDRGRTVEATMLVGAESTWLVGRTGGGRSVVGAVPGSPGPTTADIHMNESRLWPTLTALPRTPLGTAITLADAGRAELALVALDDADWADPVVATLRALLALRVGRPAEAERAVRDVSDARDPSSDLWAVRGQVALMRGADDEAEAAFLRAATLGVPIFGPSLRFLVDGLARIRKSILASVRLGSLLAIDRHRDPTRMALTVAGRSGIVEPLMRSAVDDAGFDLFDEEPGFADDRWAARRIEDDRFESLAAAREAVWAVSQLKRSRIAALAAFAAGGALGVAGREIVDLAIRLLD